jgi:SAM-dependent methyltransferase
MSYSDLLNYHKSSFYLRILVGKILKIKNSAAKNILNELKNSSNDVFLSTIKLHYTNKAISTDKQIIINHKGNINRLQKIFSMCDFSNIVTYLDFGCGTGKKTSAVSDVLNILPMNTYGLDVCCPDQLNFFTYDGINIPVNLTQIKFDLITSFQVCHHVNENYLLQILQTLISTLNPRGYFLLTEHDCHSKWMSMLVDLEHLFFSFINGDYMEVCIHKSKKEWIEIFTSLGLKLVAEFDEFNDPTAKFHMVFQYV